MSVIIKYNKLTGRIDIVKKLRWNEEVCKLDDHGRTYFYYFFERYYKLTSEKCMDKALRIEANSRAYHPICEYLEQLEWERAGENPLCSATAYGGRCFGFCL